MTTATTTTRNPLLYFFDQFAQATQYECAIFDGIAWTYGDLLRETSQDSETLVERGISSGHVVVTAGEFSLRHLSLFFSLAKLGAVNVPLPEVGDSEVGKCAAIANATHLLVVTPDGRWTLEPTSRCVTNPLLNRFLERKEAGLVVFTSGSTGDKKAILHCMSKLLGKFTVRRKRVRTISFLKLDHVGGINTVLHALSNLGMVLFPRTRSVDEICRLIEVHKLQLLPTTPSFLNLLLLSGSHLQYDLSSLELITYGTEVMPDLTLKRLHAAFPGVKLQQTYGLSELGVLRSKSRESDSLWVKIGGGGFDTRVMNGTLWIRADSAMEGYLNHPNPFIEGGWYDTGDQVEVDGEFVRFLGRESEIINVGGEKVFPAEVENFLLGLSDVKDAIVSSEPNPLLGNIVVAHIVRTSDGTEAEALQRVKTACRQCLRRYMVPVKLYFVSELEYSDRYKKLRKRTVASPASAELAKGLR
jgi:acyl-CoA synthetase (AMP-forming)/AMP-acid ligase II